MWPFRRRPNIERLRQRAAVAELSQALGHREATIRQAAAEALAAQPAPAAVPALLVALDDPVAEVQAAVVEALLVQADDELVAALIERLDGAAEPVGAVFRLLGRLSDRPAARAALATTLRTGAPARRQLAATALARRGDGAVVAPLLTALADADAEVVAAVEAALVVVGVERALPGLIDRLQHGQPAARAAAARVLGRLSDHRAVAPLAAALADTSLVVRQAACQALRLAPEPGCQIGLLAETADEPASRERTAQRLRQIGSLAPLLGALRAVDHPGLRAAAARAIGRLGQPSGLPALVEALTDPALSVRQEAAWMLGLSGRGEAIEPLSRLLASPVEPALRVTVVRALARTGQPAALAALEAASRASEPTVMAVAVAAIEQLRRRLAASESTEPIEPAEPAEPIAACRQIVLIVGAEGPAERPDYAAQLLDQLAPALLVEGVDIQVVVMAAGRPLPSLDEAAAIMRRQFMTPPAGFAWQGRQDFDQAGRPLQLWQLRALSG